MYLLMTESLVCDNLILYLLLLISALIGPFITNISRNLMSSFDCSIYYSLFAL